MKNADKKMVLAMSFATAAWFLANAQPQPRLSQGADGGVTKSSSHRGGYVSGSERGSVVQVVRDADVRAELNLSREQEQHIGDILGRVQAMEQELFVDSRRHQQAQIEAARARSGQDREKVEEAHRQLDNATKKILGLLTPAQQKQLLALCQQAAADEAGFLARMSSGQAADGFGAGGGGGGGYGGGAGPADSQAGTAHPPQYPKGSQPGVVPQSIRPGQGGGGGGGGGGFGVSSNAGHGTISRNEHRNEYASGGGPGGVVRVISLDRVQEQLRLSDAQRQQIAEITREVGQMEKDVFAKSQPPARTSANEWIEPHQQKEQTTRQAVALAGDEILTMLEPAQQKRLKEICLQALGADALFKPATVQALGLTATQQIQLASIRQEAERQISALYGAERKPGQSPAPPPVNLNSLGERSKAIQEEAEHRMINSVLSPAQQTQLRQMLGKEFAGIARLRSPTARMSSAVGTSIDRQKSK